MSATTATHEMHQTSTHRAGFALAAAVLGFFVVTLDAVVVNVALPSIRASLGGGVAGLQWIVDGYTLMFAALLLSSGALSDRIGARRALGLGMVGFVIASLACGLAPNLGLLVVARFVQGSAAAVIMPASLALIGHAYSATKARGRAVAIWAMGGSIASTSGPILGGVLTLVSWRWIFLINLPVGIAALMILTRTNPAPSRPAPFDWRGQITAIIAMGGLTYGAIEAGDSGFTTARVLLSFALAVVALVLFIAAEAKVRHPMVPLDLFRSRTVTVANAVGFAFMVGYYGLPFLFSLYFQQERGLSSLQTGLAFLPMMVIGTALTPFAHRFVERFGPKAPITTGLASMTVGLLLLGLLPAATPIWVLSLGMILVGLGGPLVMPPMTAVLLNSVPAHRSGTASGVFNTSRQVGGALAIAVFGALLADPTHFMSGLRISLIIAAVVLLVATLGSRLLRPGHGHVSEAQIEAAAAE